MSRSQAGLGRASGLIAAGGLIGLTLVFIPSSTESAIANGDTRTIWLYHAHTGETIEATYRVDGHYDPAVLAKLNWFLRDWRRNEETNMDPRLFDAVWETYRAAGATQPIVVLCGYRSPQTNAMLRRRSRGVAEHSQHILGKAMDTTMPGMSMEKVREIAMRLQMGGVGYYPSSNFVHIDVGSVRAWPRMTYDQLVRLFPDGKTVHVAADGRTLPGYEEARAEIASSGGDVSVPPPAHSQNFLAWLFGLGSGGEDEHEDAASAMAERVAQAQRAEPAASAADDAYTADAATAGTATADTEASTGADETPTADPAPQPDQASSGDVPPPMPPHRPTDLALADAAPQLRPTEQAPDLPGIITQGPKDGRTTQSMARSGGPAQSAALAYAPMAQIKGGRDEKKMGWSGAILPARLDRSDFRALTQATETAEMESQTIFGPTFTGLRQAARIETAELSSALESGYLSRFGIEATDLAADRFSGPSVASLDSDKTLTAFVDSSALRQDGE